MTGRLIAQLPRTMASDPFLQRFLRVFEDIAETLILDVDGIEHQLDPTLAPPEMLGFVGAWLAVELDPEDEITRQRDLLLAVGSLLGWRGTRHGLVGLLEALTGGPVEIIESGGAYGEDDELPSADPSVTVIVERPGRLTERALRAFVMAEVPIGTRVELRLTPAPLSRVTDA